MSFKKRKQLSNNVISLSCLNCIHYLLISKLQFYIDEYTDFISGNLQIITLTGAESSAKIVSSIWQVRQIIGSFQWFVPCESYIHFSQTAKREKQIRKWILLKIKKASLSKFIIRKFIYNESTTRTLWPRFTIDKPSRIIEMVHEQRWTGSRTTNNGVILIRQYRGALMGSAQSHKAGAI